MADDAYKTGEDPVFDTDRAWSRFEKLAGEESVPAFWKQAEDRLNGTTEDQEKEGAVEMKQTQTSRMAQGTSVVGTANGPNAARPLAADGAWRTERPARRTLRRLSAGAAAVALIVGLFATPLGDRALAAMQQTFRIQHVEGVGISMDDLSGIANLLERGSPEGDRSFNLAQYGSLTQSGGGASQTLTWEEAKARMGSSLLQLEDAAAPSYQPATSITFKLNVNAVNRLLLRLGGTTTLPDEADGKAIRLSIPAGISTEGTLSGKPARLLQYGKPELTVEGGIDAAVVREAVLELPVLPDNLRTKLAAIGDWQSTLPIPSIDGVAINLQLSGHDAVLSNDGSSRYLLWIDGNRMSLLSGAISDFPDEAAFQRAAEELI
ncbi:hypothetical protein [Cohnella sp. AR92]|uniref:hypothetical protein n=1 Tax=Cohnella sp. AR92 TaxID=648716 RepID=UPI000F8CD600|nr:hypothetical protein [Cohnella sp. AR92]RUS48939.1 hypothetical protein ELR57_00915 [Cohnella sp. AR92]